MCPSVYNYIYTCHLKSLNGHSSIKPRLLCHLRIVCISYFGISYIKITILNLSLTYISFPNISISFMLIYL